MALVVLSVPGLAGTVWLWVPQGSRSGERPAQLAPVPSVLCTWSPGAHPFFFTCSLGDCRGLGRPLCTCIRALLGRQVASPGMVRSYPEVNVHGWWPGGVCILLSTPLNLGTPVTAAQDREESIFPAAMQMANPGLEGATEPCGPSC